ncbi:putative S4 domain protein [Anopheles sinensis]|uniref:Putative S4 domain protein n=1 Tax=Anopheles sinensis TaxID=74873 RepID=A0A084VCU2_ANOSI|nr:putative S4 domain protein [Anopheles sinensis]
MINLPYPNHKSHAGEWWLEPNETFRKGTRGNGGDDVPESGSQNELRVGHETSGTYDRFREPWSWPSRPLTHPPRDPGAQSIGIVFGVGLFGAETKRSLWSPQTADALRRLAASIPFLRHQDRPPGMENGIAIPGASQLNCILHDPIRLSAVCPKQSFMPQDFHK